MADNDAGLWITLPAASIPPVTPDDVSAWQRNTLPDMPGEPEVP